MDLKDIMAIGGKPGLFRFISQAKNGIIIEGLEDKRRIPAYSSDKVSALEDIAIFTETGEVPLAEVFAAIYKKEDGKATMSHKSSPDQFKLLFEEIVPEYDRERVYVSDMKKVIMWYNILHSLGMVDGEVKKKDSEEESEEKESVVKPKKKKEPATEPKKKKAPKKE